MHFLTMRFRKITSALDHLIQVYKLAAFVTTTALFQKRPKKGHDAFGFDAAAAPSGVRESHEYSDYLGRSWQKLVAQRLVFSKELGHQGMTFSVSVEATSRGAHVQRTVIQAKVVRSEK